ncbi:hypothetical protein [Tuwongella immobilis]|uniref:Secreted protein n=1 Tax=Tuwongella immobilis TaxID=692036 RepID=A0A6C2YUL5_9BACT|nr:hypothetical protein [Tuwongella immobilis]VIP05186.1 unnamed protein product [Tuwongella immobilis]VTS07728.1 unnamed protein product [Tuwongella immobilis]
MRYLPVAMVACVLVSFSASVGFCADEDLLVEGSNWSGRRFFARDDPKTNPGQKWEFTIISRDKAGNFTGRMRLAEGKDARDYRISGRINGKSIQFKTEKKGFFQQSFEGKLASTEIAFIWAGTTDKGTQARGRAKAEVK